MPHADKTPLLKELSHHELIRVRDSLEKLCPAAVVEGPGQMATEDGRSDLLWKSARRSVIDDLNTAIRDATEKAKHSARKP